MTARNSLRSLLLASVVGGALGLGTSCGMGGYVSPGAHDLPNGGLGPFRLLDGTESEAGQAILVNGLIDSSMIVRTETGDAMLVFTSALVGERPAPVPTQPWLDRFGPRRIRRSEPSTSPTFLGEVDVLAAEASWEGAEVFDPWMIELPSGGMRLYYAADGGLGVAESASATGSFERVLEGPMLSREDVAFADGELRHPSVLFDGERFVMYFATETQLGVAFSADGLSWQDVRQLGVAFRTDVVGADKVVSLGTPSVIWRTPVVGEPFAHVFLEARLDDGTRQLAVAGTRDHDSFEAAFVPKIGRGENLGSPAAFAWDERITVLTFLADKNVSGGPGRALYVSVSPGTARFTRTTDGATP